MSGRDDGLSPLEGAISVRPDRPTIEVLGTERLAQATRLLFRGGYDTVELAALFGMGEAEIIDLLHGRALPRGSR